MKSLTRTVYEGAAAPVYPHDVTVKSYGNFCERIIIKPAHKSDDCNKISKQTYKSTNTRAPNATISYSSSSAYLNPPIQSHGTVFDLSDRPILCSSQFRDEVVFGGSDHAAYAVKLSHPSPCRTPENTGSAHAATSSSSSSFTILYGKSHGHTDWVTAAAHLSDGRALTGGMDARLCLWSRDKRTCAALDGHDMSIAKLVSIHPFNIVVSTGYDKKVCVWKLPCDEALTDSHSRSRYTPCSSISSRVSRVSTPIRPSEVLLGHTDPVVECAVVGASGGGGTMNDGFIDALLGAAAAVCGGTGGGLLAGVSE